MRVLLGDARILCSCPCNGLLLHMSCIVDANAHAYGLLSLEQMQASCRTSKVRGRRYHGFECTHEVRVHHGSGATAGRGHGHTASATAVAQEIFRVVAHEQLRQIVIHRRVHGIHHRLQVGAQRVVIQEERREVPGTESGVIHRASTITSATLVVGRERLVLSCSHGD